MSEQLTNPSSPEQLQERDSQHVIDVLRGIEASEYANDPQACIEKFNEALSEAGYVVQLASYRNTIKIPAIESSTPGEGVITRPDIGEDGKIYVAALKHHKSEAGKGFLPVGRVSLDEVDDFNSPALSEFEVQKAKATQRQGRGSKSSANHSKLRTKGFKGHNHKSSSTQASDRISSEATQLSLLDEIHEIGNAAEPKIEIDPLHEEWAQKYLKDTDFFTDEEFAALSDARVALAEASVKARRSNLLYSKDRKNEQLKGAIESYKQERQIVFKEIIEALDGDISVAQKKALLAQLSIREDGALMGEEANYYLTKENSWSKRMMEKYKSASKVKKFFIGVGGTAVVGVGAGVVGGVAAAGAVVGARLGRGYANREARRNGEVRSLQEKQQEATLHESNMEDYITLYRNLKTVRSRDENSNFTETRNEDLVSTVEDVHMDVMSRSDEAYLASMDKAQQERYRKQKSLIWATGGAAVGALAGELIENGLNFGAEAPDTPEVPVTPETGTGNEQLQDLLDHREDLIDEREGLIEQLGDAEDRLADLETDAEQMAPEVSPELEYLFGELAGENIHITIPEDGTVWDELELLVDREAPQVSFDEKQRLVGNMVERLQQQYPGRDLDLVQPGEAFTTKLQ